jgi:hypothetical protein
MKWRREEHKIDIGRGIVQSFAFYRAWTARHGEAVSLVVGPTADGRWQARSGPSVTNARSGPSTVVRTLDIANDGDWHGTYPTPGRAKRAIAGWADGA